MNLSGVQRLRRVAEHRQSTCRLPARLLVALFARAHGAEVHVLGRDADQLSLARTLGFDGTWTRAALPARWT